MRVRDIEYLERVIREEPELLSFRFTNDKKELPLKEYEKLVRRNIKSVNYTSTPFGIYAFPFKYFFKDLPKSLEDFFEIMSQEGVEAVDYAENEEEGEKKRLLLLSKGGVLYYDNSEFVKFIKIKRGARLWILGENDPEIDLKTARSFTLGLIRSYISGIDSKRTNSLDFLVRNIFNLDRGYFPLFLLSSLDSILFRSLADLYDASVLCAHYKFLPLEEIVFGMLLGERKWIKEMSKVVYSLLSSDLARYIDREFFYKSRSLEIEDSSGEKYIDLPTITLVLSASIRMQTLFLNKSFLSANEDSLKKHLCSHLGLGNLSRIFYPRAYEKMRGYLRGAEKWSDEEYSKNRDRIAYTVSKYFSLSAFSLAQRISKYFRQEIDEILSITPASKEGFSKESYERMVESISSIDHAFYMLLLSVESFMNPILLFPFYSYENFINELFEKSSTFSSIYSNRENRKKIMELYTHMADLGRRGDIDKKSKSFSKIVEYLERRYYGISKMVLFKYFQLDDSKVNRVSNYRKTRFISNFIMSLGFDVLVDPGFGMIHPNEPVQMVILNEDSIEKTIVVENIYYSYFKALRALRKTAKRVLGLFGRNANTEEMGESEVYRLVYRYLKEEILSQESRLASLGLSLSPSNRERILHGLVLLSKDLREMEKVRNRIGLKDEEASRILPPLLKAIDEVIYELSGRKRVERVVKKAMKLSRVRGGYRQTFSDTLIDSQRRG